MKLKSRSLIHSVTLSILSVTSAFVFGGSVVQAGEGHCGDSAKPCKETTQPKAHIKYTLTNRTQQTLKFALPSGKIYQLAPGQRQNYQNTLPSNRLRLYLFAENKFYPLGNGNYQFRQNPQGQIKLLRFRSPKPGVPWSKLPKQPSPKIPPIILKPEIYYPQNDNIDQAETILPLLIDKVGDILVELIKQQPAVSHSSDAVSEEVQPPTIDGSLETAPTEPPTPETANPDPSDGTGISK
ncbi:hypothetical protein H6F89_30810 [Cyanobacteria bacterium FACHB-63]|nr:hypothetical protein [Cyanobacteria bacterium FACHB-63]